MGSLTQPQKLSLSRFATRQAASGKLLEDSLLTEPATATTHSCQNVMQAQKQPEWYTFSDGSLKKEKGKEARELETSPLRMEINVFICLFAFFNVHLKGLQDSYFTETKFLLEKVHRLRAEAKEKERYITAEILAEYGSNFESR